MRFLNVFRSRKPEKVQKLEDPDKIAKKAIKDLDRNCNAMLTAEEKEQIRLQVHSIMSLSGFCRLTTEGSELLDRKRRNPNDHHEITDEKLQLLDLIAVTRYCDSDQIEDRDGIEQLKVLGLVEDCTDEVRDFLIDINLGSYIRTNSNLIVS